MCSPGSDRNSAVAGERPLIDLEHEICVLAAHQAATMCRWLTLVAEFDEREGWRADGILSCAHWLSWRCSIGLRAGREYVRVAHALNELPIVREAFGRGELSYCKVRALTRAVTPATEEAFVELARHATGAQLEKVVRGYRGTLRASTGQARRAHEQRHLSYFRDDDGSVVFSGRLPAGEGALFLKALEAATEQAASRCSAEHPPPLPDPATDAAAEAENRPGARRADALVALARAGLDADAHDRTGGDPVELVVHVDAQTLAAERIRERCEVDGGPALAPETARRLGCDAALTRIIERDGRPLSISRRTHHWARGGPTKLDNLVQLCSHHHRLVHEGGYHVERAGPAIRFRRPGGREIAAVPAAVTAHSQRTGPRDARDTIDHTTIRPLSAGDTLDYSIAVECLLAKADHAPAILSSA